MENVTRQDLDRKAEHINGQFGTSIKVTGQNGYFNIYDTANGHERLATGDTKRITMNLLYALEKGMRMVENRIPAQTRTGGHNYL